MTLAYDGARRPKITITPLPAAPPRQTLSQRLASLNTPMDEDFLSPRPLRATPIRDLPRRPRGMHRACYAFAAISFVSAATMIAAGAFVLTH